MLVLGSRLIGTAVMSLQTGGRLARTIRPVIDPGTLTIIAYEVDGPLLTERPSFLRIADVRETSGIGMIVDSADEFVGAEDVIKIKELNELGFVLIGMKVIDERRHKLGKVEDYTLESGDFVIQQLKVRRNGFSGIANTNLLIHRSQIVEINDQYIVVKATDRKEKATTPVGAVVRDYVNPFRQGAPVPTPEPLED